MERKIKEKITRTQESLAREYFARDEKLFADMSECVRRGAAAFDYVSENAVLLHEKNSGIYMLAADGEEEAEKALRAVVRADGDCIREASGLLVAHGGKAEAAARRILRFDGETCCYQVVYTRKSPRILNGGLEFRAPEAEQIALIKKNYDKESPENIDALCAAGQIVCGFVADRTPTDTYGGFVGFIGRHPEGSMGLLHVFPEYRRRGYGEELESYMINRFLSEGRVPYAHIIEDNFRSMNLQKKLGYEIADEKIYWLFDRD